MLSRLSTSSHCQSLLCLFCNTWFFGKHQRKIRVLVFYFLFFLRYWENHSLLRYHIRVSSLKSTVEHAPAGEKAWLLVLKSLIHSLKNGISSSSTHLSLCGSHQPLRLSGPGLTWLRCSMCCVEREVFSTCMWIFSTGDNGRLGAWVISGAGLLVCIQEGLEREFPSCPPITSLAGQGNSHHLETFLSKQH